MSRPIVCDTCGAMQWDAPYGEPEQWHHNYATGKDECGRCLARRRNAADAAMWNRIRVSIGLPEKPPTKDTPCTT